MIKKIKQSKNKKGDGHLGHLPAYLPGPAPPAGPAHRRLPPLSPSSSARRTGTRPARAATRPGHLLPAWLPPPPLVPSRDATQPPRTPLTLPRGPAPLLFLSRPNPNTAVATDAVRRGHHPPLASPTPPRAPQVLPRPPRRLTRPEEPRNAAPDVFPLAGRRGSSPSNSATPARPRAR